MNASVHLNQIEFWSLTLIKMVSEVLCEYRTAEMHSV